MATKSANLYARIEPEVKEKAESILSTLGIPASSAINMFYKQIILQRGLPFEVNLNFQKFFHSNVKIGAYLLQHSNLHYFTPVFVSKISIRNGNIASCSLTYD